MFAGGRKEQKLAALRLFEACNTDAIRTIARSADEVDVRAGEILCRATDRVRPFLVVLEGRAQLTGDATPPYVLVAGETYGAEAILDGDVQPVDARMLTDGRVLVVEPRTFRTLAAKLPGLGIGVARELARRLTTQATRRGA